jgi:predicted membrane protein
MGRLIRWTFGGLIVAMGSLLAGAAVAKRRLPSVGTEESNEVALTAILEPIEFESHATAFKGGSLLTWFGGGDVDLRGVRLDPAGATLNVRTLFGGGRLIVPETWNVDLRLRAVFGGSADIRPAFERAPDAPTLVVEGIALFGGFAVMSSKPEIEDADLDALDEAANGE